MTSYDNIFTITDGVNTLTFNVKPEEIDFDRQVNIAKHKIPGSTGQQSIQHLGHSGFKISYEKIIYGNDSLNIIPIDYNGTWTDGRDIAAILEGWYIAGTPLTFRCDYVYFRNGLTALTVIITEFNLIELPGIAHSYQMTLVLEQYNAGSSL